MEVIKRIKRARKTNNLKGKINRKELLKKFYKRTKNIYLLQRFLNHSPAEQTIRYVGFSEQKLGV